MKKFFLVLVLVLFTQPLYAATIYLGIGVNAKVKTNDDYAPEIIALHNIIKPGLSRHILGSDVTTNNVTKGLEWLNKTATETDISIVYISAHGHYDKNYRFSGYNWEKIYGSLIAQYINITKGKIILIVDTCHSGGILKENWTNTKIAIFTACREDESSWGRYFCEKLYEAFSQAKPICTFDIERYINRNIATNKQTPMYKNKSIVLTTDEPPTLVVRQPYKPIAWQFGN